MADKSVFVDCFLSHNLGDDLFFFTLVSRYPKVNFTVYADRSYEYLSNRFPNVKLITSAESSSSRFGTADKIMRVCSAMRQRIALIREADAMVTIGGSIYMESKARGPKERLQRLYRSCKDASYAKAAGHYFILGANFGPYYSQQYLDSYRRFFERRCDDVCFRETYSAGLFPSVKSVRSAPDVLFTADLPSVPKRRQAFFSVVDLDNDGKFGALRDRRRQYEDWLLRSINECSQTGYDVVLASFSEPEGDVKAVSRLAEEASRQGSDVQPLFYTDNMDEVLRELAASEIVVGTRFHATILGLVAGARVLPIMYSDKTKHVLQDIDFDMADAVDLKRTTDDELAAVSPVRDAVAFDVHDVIAAAQCQFAALDAFLGERESLSDRAATEEQ